VASAALQGCNVMLAMLAMPGAGRWAQPATKCDGNSRIPDLRENGMGAK
jgi:hypothetical protein